MSGKDPFERDTKEWGYGNRFTQKKSQKQTKTKIKTKSLGQSWSNEKEDPFFLRSLEIFMMSLH